MAQKINPVSLRLEKTNRSVDSSWFNQSNYVNLFMKDLKIQWYIDLIFKKVKFCSARYSIIHLPTKIKINIFFCNPNKNRKYISKIFYLNYPKKSKKVEKNLFNKAHIGISTKQGKIFQYLMKSFNDYTVQLSISKKHTKLLCNRNIPEIKNDNKNNRNTLFLFQNYLKLMDFIKPYNQFYIRYFLIKYFSIKFPAFFANQEKTTLKKQKNNSASIISPLCKFNYKNLVFIDLNQSYALNSLKKAHKNMVFKCILGFFFLQIYKNKNILALKYFYLKINRYKEICLNSNLIYKKPKKHQLKKTVGIADFEKKSNYNCLNSNLMFTPIALKHKKPIVFFFYTFSQLKIKILSFLKKKKINFKPHSYVKKNTELYLISRNNSKKKFVPTFTDINSLTRLTTCFQQLQFYNRKQNFINFTSHVSYIAFSEANQKYCNLSLMNTQCINDTYNNYCKLFQFCKYYDAIYLRANTSHNKNFFLLQENTRFNQHINFFEINNEINNITSCKPKLIQKKKFILPSSPYKFHMEAVLGDYFSRNLNFHFFQTSNMFQNAFFLIDEVVYYIEKRVPFFKIKNYILKKLAEQNLNNIKGIRVTCSGRIPGKSKKAQRSKVQNFKYGETSLHVFSSKIDFKSKNAFTPFGKIGVKIWICYH